MEMEQLINRINELSRKSKSQGLSEQEVAERDRLRKQYLSVFKSNFRQELDRIEVVDQPQIKH